MEKEPTMPHPSENEPTTIDISNRVRALFEMPHDREFMKAKLALQRELKANPPQALTLTLDYTTLDDAKTLKLLKQFQPVGGNWRLAIRCNESQEKEAANVFASDVECIRIDE